MNNLIDKYLSGVTTTREEHVLLGLLSRKATLTERELAVKTMLLGAPMQVDPQWLQEDASGAYDHIVALRRRRRVVLWRWTGIAAAACLAVGLFLLVPGGDDSENCTMARIYGQETTDEALVLGMMENTMQSVLACSTTDHIEGQLTDILNP